MEQAAGLPLKGSGGSEAAGGKWRQSTSRRRANIILLHSRVNVLLLGHEEHLSDGIASRTRRIKQVLDGRHPYHLASIHVTQSEGSSSLQSENLCLGH